MNGEITYLTPERIVELNLFAITYIKVKKADSAKLLSYIKLADATNECQEASGDLYDKAVALMKGIIQKHPFASGNRRTAFIAAKIFLTENKAKFGIPDDPSAAKVMQGIRENYYANEEIKRWLQHGKIRTFVR